MKIKLIKKDVLFEFLKTINKDYEWNDYYNGTYFYLNKNNKIPLYDDISYLDLFIGHIGETNINTYKCSCNLKEYKNNQIHDICFELNELLKWDYLSQYKDQLKYLQKEYEYKEIISLDQFHNKILSELDKLMYELCEKLNNEMIEELVNKYLAFEKCLINIENNNIVDWRR